LGAALAFYTMLSLAPLLVVVTAVLPEGTAAVTATPGRPAA
jgi:uncharacterized BrkB/YihY/UPF0761 family membrane protein